jgi:hypothetical protein
MTILGALYLPKPDRSAQILGTLEYSKRKDPNLEQDPFISRYYGRAEVHARKNLGHEAFEIAFAEGQKLSLDEALDLAMKTVEEIR